MQIVRIILWILVAFATLTFSAFNWESVEVTLWDNLVLETKLPALVIIAFLLGLVPMWLYHRSVTWSLGRRIRSLENSIKSTALAHRREPDESKSGSPSSPPSPTDTPLETSASKDDTLKPTSSDDKESAA